MDISRKSWHFRFASFVSGGSRRTEEAVAYGGFCGYWRHFLLCALIAAFVAFLATTPLLFIITCLTALIAPFFGMVVDWEMLLGTKGNGTIFGALFTIGGVMTFALMILGGCLGASKLREYIKDRRRAARYDAEGNYIGIPDKPPGLFSTAWQSFKDKACPMANLVD